MTYQAGAARVGITSFHRGVGMMGYGKIQQYVEEQENPLFARAIVIKAGESGNRIVWVNAEICFITLAIKAAVMERLGADHPQLDFTTERVMLTAQHTHSGPGGYSHHAFYNMSIPGYVPVVFETIVNGIVEAIVRADQVARPVTIRAASGEFPMDWDVAFNRSLAAYQRNPEVRPGLKASEANAAVDRRMLLFRLDGSDGLPLASWNFFGVHATSISNDQHRICSDNKGYAAAMMEQALDPEVVCVFAQRKAGDVTPNHIFDRRKGWTRGSHEDDFQSARENGRLQSDHALKLYESASRGEELPVETDAALSWLDFTGARVDPMFSNSEADARTGSACHGVGFVRGTREGPGVPKLLADLGAILSRGLKAWELMKTRWMDAEAAEMVREKYRIQGAKEIVFETGAGKMLGIHNFSRLPLPGFIDGGLAAFKRFHASGGLSGRPWVPQVLPLQLIILGPYAFAGIPAEVTTIAGRRIEESLLEILSKRGVTEVVAASYCNGYCGYITTMEEYDEQAYEGGHTVFGKHTLGAVQTRFRQMAVEMLKPEGERRIPDDGEPPAFTPQELALRSFDPECRKC